MKKNLNNLLWLSLIAISITACNKPDPAPNNNNAAGTAQAKSLLVDKKWYLEKSEYFENDTLVETNTPSGCEADDYNILKSNGDAIEGRGTQLCSWENSQDPSESITGKWSLSSDNKKLIIVESECDDTNCTQIFFIKTLTSTNLIIYVEGTELDDNDLPIKFKSIAYLKTK